MASTRFYIEDQNSEATFYITDNFPEAMEALCDAYAVNWLRPEVKPGLFLQDGTLIEADFVLDDVDTVMLFHGNGKTIGPKKARDLLATWGRDDRMPDIPNYMTDDLFRMMWNYLVDKRKERTA